MSAGRRAHRDLHFEVEQLYYQEAELLDDGRYADWLEMLADDLDYWMPTRTNRLRRQQALSIAARGEAAFYDETKESLAWRIRRFDSGMAWAEDPPSRTRHLVTNVQVRHADPASEPGFGDSRPGRQERLPPLPQPARARGGRVRRCAAPTSCVVWRTDGSSIARREVLLDQNVLLAKNISTFF